MASDRRALRSGVAAAATCSVAAVVMSPLVRAFAVALLAVGIGFVASFTVQAWRHRAITVALRRTSTADRIAGLHVRMAPVSSTAFVAGLARPEIFCGRSLSDELSPDELRAVALHERAHQLARDPLRATALAAVAPVLQLTTPGRRWLEAAAASREIAADRYALDQGVRRSALASALLKVQPVSATHAAAFAPAVDMRLRALVESHAVTSTGPLRRSLVAGVAIGLAACLAMLHPLHAILATLCC